MADDDDSFAFVPFLDLCQHAADPAADASIDAARHANQVRSCSIGEVRR